MTALISYQFEEDPVRVVMIAGDPWFVANDLCRVLGIANSRQALSRLDEDERGVSLNDTLGGVQEMNVVSESGMYALVLGSRKAEAKRFRKWVTGEVLPSIRHTGRYELPGYEPPPALPLNDDPARISAEVALVREARRVFGPAGARSIWIQRGLPQPIADSEGSLLGDPLAAKVRDWLQGRTETCTSEVALGIGLGAPDFVMRRRLAALMRLYGWDRHSFRRGHKTIRRWVRLEAVEG